MSEPDIKTFTVTVRDGNKLTGEGPTGLWHADLDVDDLQRRTIDTLIGMLGSSRLSGEPEYQLLGEHLYNVLLDNDIGRELRRLIVDRVQIRLDLVFESQQHRYASWPWEFLYWPRKDGEAVSGKFLSVLKSLVISRNLRLNTAEPDTELKESELPLRVAFVATGPRRGLTREEYEQVGAGPIEFSGLLDGLKDLVAKTAIPIKIFDFVDPDVGEHRVSLSNFIEYCTTVARPHVIHFVGHGRWENGGQLLFMKPDGSPEWVSEDRFADALLELNTLKLVFLGACESAMADPQRAVSGVARLLAHNNIPAVVAMQYKIGQYVANEFATQFYTALAKPMPIELAVQTARSYVARELNDWDQKRAFGLPVLYIRKSGALLPKPAQASQRVSDEQVRPEAQQTPAREVARAPSQVFTVRTDVTPTTCVWCSWEAQGDDLYCGKCGGQVHCGSCGVRIARKDSFCRACRAALQGPITTGAPALSASPLGVRVSAQN